MKELLEETNRRPLVVASLGGEERLVDSARRATKLGADLIEIRIDSLKPKERANIKELIAAIKEATACPLICTVRSLKEQGPDGNAAQMDRRERTILFKEAIPLVDRVDLELEGDPSVQEALGWAKAQKKTIIFSFHDFTGIPSEEKLKGLEAEFIKLEGNILKIAGMAKTQGDVVQILQMCHAAAGVKRAFIAMGDIGRISRVAGYFFGSCLAMAT